MKYYIVYKITNLCNHKIYVGIHKTDNLNDNYMGSGTNIMRAIKKYGVSNFKKEYIHIFDNENDMYKMESILVDKEFIKRHDTYNIKEGGNGGWQYVNSHYDSELRKKNALHANKCVPADVKKRVGKNMGDIYGGRNKLDNSDIQHRLNILKNIDMTQYGWVQKASKLFNCSHTQVRRFVKKHYKESYYIRKK